MQALADLVLPAACAGCGGDSPDLSYGVCPPCVRLVKRLEPVSARPDPAPEGLPPTVTLGEYGGVLRELIIGFKDRGRHRLGRPLGGLLAEAVVAAVPPRVPVLLLYVPDTAAAARQRHGDHMRRLATLAAARLRDSGRFAAASRALTARPAVADSAGLTQIQRAELAQERFVVRQRGIARTRDLAGQAAVVLADDIMTTVSTLASAAQVLAASGISVAACATLAATRRRLPGLIT